MTQSDSNEPSSSDVNTTTEPTPTISEAKAIYKEAFGLFVAGDLDAAIDRYRVALEIDAELSIAWNGLSIALAKKGDLEAAVEAAEKLIEVEPDDPLSHTNLSRILMQQGLIPEAEDARAKAMGLQMKQGS
jgi:tetratricopeptide (TPR) repeat protein